MRNFSQYKIPAFAIAAYFIFYFLIYDQLQYLLDSDAVAYLTIAQRVADGDWLKSINGLWSPLNSWLLVPFIKGGINPWAAAKGLNAFFGAVLIFQFWSLLKQLNFSNDKLFLGSFTFVIPICFFAYFQVFGDVLQLIFALAYISLVLKKDFLYNTRLVLLAAIFMGIGYYAKAYSLVFFVLHFSVLAFMAYFKDKGAMRMILRNYVLGVGVIIFMALPWSYQLNKKYDTFSLTGMAGKLNMSWYINSGKTFNDSIELIIPPPYDDSPTFWEDPYLSAGELSTPFSSVHHFKRWVLRVGHTCLMALKSANEISIFFVPLFLLFFIGLVKRKKIPNIQLKILWVIILLPLGYLAMHIETRYIWLLAFLIFILGLYKLEELDVSRVYKRFFVTVFCISFVVFPFYMIRHLKDKNKELFFLAKELKQHNIQGKIVSNLDDEGSFWVVSYLAGLNNYTIEHGDYSLKELAQEMKRYHIRYYYHGIQQGGHYNEEQQAFKLLFEPVFHSKQAPSSLYKLRD